MTARVLVLLVMVAACGDNRAPHDDAGARDAAVPDADAPFSCEPSQTCADGPACGSGCCGTGEHCVGGTCMCGSFPACTDGNTCQNTLFAPGPCGFVCCGTTQGCPV